MEGYFFIIGSVVVIVAIIVIGNVINKSQKKEAAERIRLAKNAGKRAAAAEKVRKIQWQGQFVVDQGVIDKDHQILFSLVNEFIEGISVYQSPDQMVSVLASLTNYTQTHFQREEKLQQASGYLFCEEHKKEHEALIEKFNGLKQRAVQANEDNITDVAVEIGSFLREWLTKHVLESDLPLRPFVDRMREDSMGMEELRPEDANAASL
ncbi:MAG: hemerythrin family protein [Rhodospirillales bacterium]|nr:hemerythrin family protein [Rhodospirillales bacterium]